MPRISAPHGVHGIASGPCVVTLPSIGISWRSLGNLHMSPSPRPMFARRPMHHLRTRTELPPRQSRNRRVIFGDCAQDDDLPTVDPITVSESSGVSNLQCHGLCDLLVVGGLSQIPELGCRFDRDIRSGATIMATTRGD